MRLMLKKELISKENIIKHDLLYNLIRFISTYFLPDAHNSTFFFQVFRGKQKFTQVEFTYLESYVRREAAVLWCENFVSFTQLIS